MSAPSPRKTPLARIAVLGLALALAFAALLFWKEAALKGWLRARAVSYYLNRVQPHLPFEIESVDADASLGDLLHGRLKSLSTVLRWHDVRLRMSGPIDIQRPTRERPSFIVKFDSRSVLEQVGSSPDAASSPFALDLYVEASSSLDRLSELALHARADAWEWKQPGLTLQSPELAAGWKGERADLGVSLRGGSWRDSSRRQIEIGELTATAQAPLKLTPFALGPELQGRLNIPWLATKPFEFALHSPELSWKIPELRIRPLLESALKAGFEPRWTRTIDIRDGTIRGEGRLQLDTLHVGTLPKAQGAFVIENGALQARGAAFAAQGVRIELPFSTPSEIRARISADALYYKKARARLAPTELSFEKIGRTLLSPEGIQVRLHGQKEPAIVPLAIDGVPAAFGAVSGRILSQGRPWELETSLKLPPTPLEKIAHPLCLKAHDHYPPAELEADFSQISLSPGAIEPEGHATAKLFDGVVRVEDLGFFELGTGAPEVDFNLDFEGIRLEKLCDWSGFGDVSGTLQGFAHDMTFQGWLPTHFDFSLDALPLRSASTIGMDPQAMYNLVSLFAGDALAHIPIVAHEGYFNRIFDPYFGWLSKRIGGFDLRYLGLSLFSDGGTILLETHDPPGIYERLKKHYIFWGHRFNMPVLSPHYPVVMDETGMARIFQYMVKRAQLIAKLKREKGDPHDSHDPNETDDPNCLPPVF